MSDFHKKKNFANPRTMFKSCSNNDEFSTQPIQTGSKKKGAKKPDAVASGSGSDNSSKTDLTLDCSSNTGSRVSSPATTPVLTPRSEANDCVSDVCDIASLDLSDHSERSERSEHSERSDETGAVSDSNDTMDSSSETDPGPSEPHHPLQNEWTLWYLETDRTKSWEETLHEVYSFETVENFWSLMNHIKTPSEIKMGSDYYLFKKGIRPMWEDGANVKGGRWVINVSKCNKQDLDNFWLETMMLLIGETCQYSQELCGAVVNIRPKNNKISIWTANGNNEAAAMEIGGKLRESLRMDSAYQLRYQLHKDTMVKQKSVVKSMYTC